MVDTQTHPLLYGNSVEISRDRNHRYWIGSDGPKMPSVTSLTKHIDGDGFGAGLGWGLKMARHSGGDLDAPHRIASESRRIGNQLHDAIAGFISTGAVSEEPLFLAWFHAVGKTHKWAASERFLYHPQLSYGGTLDALSYDPDGNLSIWDWKTRERESYEKNGSYQSEVAQISAYRDCLISMGSRWTPIASGFIVYVMRDATGRQLSGEVDVVEVDLAHGSKLFQASRCLYRLLHQGGE